MIYRKKIITVIISLFILSLTLHAQSIHQFQLMPYPEEVISKEGMFRIDRELSIAVSGNPGSKIYNEATRFIRRLDDKTGMFFKQGFVTPDSTPSKTNLAIEIEKPAEIKLAEDESYSIMITPENIQINSKTDLGAIHSLQTLLQLLSIDSAGYYFPAVEINDSPRFQWRGLMIDAARHFMPVDVIKRNIDGMAAVKLNVLHLHLSDDQGFRVECKSFPKLHQLGSDGLYYTQTQIKDIIKYANDRGIRVYPEFDMPGHTTSWLVGYPELASAPGPYSIERRWGVFNPAFNPTIEETYSFLDKFFKEMSSLFTDEYIHVGGDENNGVQWDANKKIEMFKKEKSFTSNEQLQAYFINRVQKILTRYGKKMIGWDEILQKNTPKTAVIQSWRGREALIKSAKEGYKGILSNGYYIDLMQPASFHYLNDPLPDTSGLTPEEQSRILGGEATMWAEWVVPENIDSRIWPRTAAIAERFWSPEQISDVDDMYKRLDHISFLLEEYGLTHISFQPVMLRRLTNNQAIETLKTFIDFVKPLEGYERNNFEKYGGYEYTQYSPHSLVVDAAVADPENARELNNLIIKFLDSHDIKTEIQIKNSLTVLADNHEKLLKIIFHSPILKEIEPLSSNLSLLAKTGLEALQFFDKKTKADNMWTANANNVLNQSLTSYAKVQIAITNEIKKLIEAVE